MIAAKADQFRQSSRRYDPRQPESEAEPTQAPREFLFVRSPHSVLPPVSGPISFGPLASRYFSLRHFSPLSKIYSVGFGSSFRPSAEDFRTDPPIFFCPTFFCRQNRNRKMW